MPTTAATCAARLLARGQACHAQGDFVGLGTRTAEHNTLDIIRMQGRQALGIVNNTFMQVATVHIETGLLAGHGVGNHRIAVTHAGHIVIHVRIAPAVRIKQIDAVATNQMQGLLVEQLGACAKGAIAALDQCFDRHGSAAVGDRALTTSGKTAKVNNVKRFALA